MTDEKHALVDHPVKEKNPKFDKDALEAYTVLDFKETPRNDVEPYTDSPPRYKIQKSVDKRKGMMIKLEAPSACASRHKAAVKAAAPKKKEQDRAKDEELDEEQRALDKAEAELRVKRRKFMERKKTQMPKVKKTPKRLAKPAVRSLSSLPFHFRSC